MVLGVRSCYNGQLGKTAARQSAEAEEVCYIPRGVVDSSEEGHDWTFDLSDGTRIVLLFSRGVGRQPWLP